MKTKAQKAAEEHIRQNEKLIIRQIEDGYSCDYEEMVNKIEEIQRIIEEFNLDRKLFNQTIEKIYKRLMKEKKPDIAARFAQRYDI